MAAYTWQVLDGRLVGSFEISDEEADDEEVEDRRCVMESIGIGELPWISPGLAQIP